MDANDSRSGSKPSKLLGDIQRFKGIVGPIAQKCFSNIELKLEEGRKHELKGTKDSADPNQQNSNDPSTFLQHYFYHFAIGHAFKQLDAKALFEMKLDEGTRNLEPNRYKSLTKSGFFFKSSNSMISLKNLLENIRNIFCHCVHKLEPLRMDGQSDMMEFIHESFEVAVRQSFLDLRLKMKGVAIDQSYDDKEVVPFLAQCFSPKTKKDEQSQSAKDDDYKIANLTTPEFCKLSLHKAISTLLFVDVPDDYQWTIGKDYEVFTLKKGRYLSFYACLFLIAMFLYKDEANGLISKIKGFKRNDDDRYRSKRNIFTFFSKKFSSEDLNSEMRHLVMSRDIIQYLNKYPTCWNATLESSTPVLPQMVKPLNERVRQLAISSAFLDSDDEVQRLGINPERFTVYALNRLWGDDRKSIYSDFSEIKRFNKLIEDAPRLRNARQVLHDLKNARRRDERMIAEQEAEVARLEKENLPNEDREKLAERIKNKSLLTSFGRNQDRFMLMATQYLAEAGYFGDAAKFRMYQFFYPEVENEHLESLRVKVRRKEPGAKRKLDALKYHQGKLVHFISYEDASNDKNKEGSDFIKPFVVDANAIHVQLTLQSGESVIVVVQRALMVYLLYHALSSSTKGAGYELLSRFYCQKIDEQQRSMECLQSAAEPADRARMKKLLPRRLLNHYLPSENASAGSRSSLLLDIEKAERSEERYQRRRDKAIKENSLPDFEKRNKGKQHKLSLIRKAWNLMFFREVYQRCVEESGEHHKRYHITRDEFNLFCRYMYAFDDKECRKYKEYLVELLDEKHFLDNEALRSMINRARSIDDLYRDTMEMYRQWIDGAAPLDRSGRFGIEGYISKDKGRQLIAGKMLYVNLSHFIGFLEGEGVIKRNASGMLDFEHLKGGDEYLIREYYCKDGLPECRRGEGRKLFNQLKKTMLEDMLLYEVALRYLKVDSHIAEGTRTAVDKMLTQTVSYDIKDVKGNVCYTLKAPFKQIRRVAELLSKKEEQEKRKLREIERKKSRGEDVSKDEQEAFSFLENLARYLRTVKFENDDSGRRKKGSSAKEVSEFLKEKGMLTLDHLYKMDNYITTTSNSLTTINMALEEYFIVEENLKIKKTSKAKRNKTDNRIDFGDIKGLNHYYDKGIRDKAYHHLVPPENGYDAIAKEVEAKFIKEQVLPAVGGRSCYNDLSIEIQKVCDVLIEINNNSFLDWRELDTKKRWKDAEKRFFREKVKGENAMKKRSIALQR